MSMQNCVAPSDHVKTSAKRQAQKIDTDLQISYEEPIAKFVEHLSGIPFCFGRFFEFCPDFSDKERSFRETEAEPLRW
jgi:hypothetical protein